MKISKLLAALALASAAVAAWAQPVKLRVNYSVVPPHLVPVLFMKKDLIRHEGKSYTTDFIYTGGSSLVLQAMAANEMDLGVYTMTAFAAAVQNAKMPLVMIADLVTDGPWFTAVYGVKADSPYRSIKDLKGKTIAVNAFGGGHDAAGGAAGQGAQRRRDQRQAMLRPAGRLKRRASVPAALDSCRWRPAAMLCARVWWSLMNSIDRLRAELHDYGRRWPAEQIWKARKRG